MNRNQTNNIEYAIVDIETTGGNASGSRITEIAILIHNGVEVINRFETLVNPEKDIPVPIFALTGINNEMVKSSPVFGDIAEQVYHLLLGRVFVAHNVNFDYSFVKHQLGEEGYPWSASRLCTVRMSRKLRPGLPSYSLGNLCNSLDIPIENRHRAGGDAFATALLFDQLLRWDTERVIPEMLKRNSGEQQLPPNLAREDYEKLPGCAGVYYFLDQQGKVVYVGKAVNIKKRVASHFSGNNIHPQRQHFLRSIYSVTYEACGTELMALLLECTEIKRLWPVYNRALKRFEPKYGLYAYEDQRGFIRLAIGKLSKQHLCILPFYRLYDAISKLNEMISRHRLERSLCHFGTAAGRPPDPDASGVVELPEPGIYNEQVQHALRELEDDRASYAIIDKGRHPDEKSCIWVEKGSFYAMGYIANGTDLNEPEDIRNSLTRYGSNYYMMQLIESFTGKHPGKVMRFNRLHSMAEYNS